MSTDSLDALIEDASVTAANAFEDMPRGKGPLASPADCRPVVVAVVAGARIAALNHLGRARPATGGG